jgi:hypothetical protein
MAVQHPEQRMAGLDVASQPTPAVLRRSEQFFVKQDSIAMMAVFSDVGLATIIQCLARELRASPELRSRHGQRFLMELAQHWNSALRL